MLTLLLLTILLIVVIAGFITRNSLRVEIIRLRLELASATAARDALLKSYEGMRDIAAKAIEAATQAAPERVKATIQVAHSDYLPDPDPYDVKFCGKCNVSLRGTVWPVDCPACGAIIGDVLDADEIG